MIANETTLGVILAGGLSRRMQGREKSLIELAGKPLVSRVSNHLGKQVPHQILNANGDHSRFEFLKLATQSDTVEGFAGPLAGVLAGMAWAAKNKPEMTHIITAAADTPFFPENYVKTMISQANDKNAEIALAGSNERHHPVFGLWPIALQEDLQKFLVDEENRKVMLFVERYRNCRVDFASDGIDPFFNVNTPEDLAIAEKLAGKLN